MPFRPYRFEHPNTEAMEVISGSSYAAAAVFGPLYILYRRSTGFWPALGVMIVLTLGIVALSGVTSFFLPPKTQLLAILVSIPVALIIQAHFVINLVKTWYRRRGWLVRAP
jgi:hypothetical protein